MKMVHVSDYYNHTGHFINAATRILKSRGHDVNIITSSASFDKTIKTNVKLSVLRGKIIFGKNIYPELVLKMLLDETPDVVHSYVIGFFSTFVSGYIKKLKKYPLVVEADIGIQSMPSIFKKPYFVLYRKIPAQAADILTTYTQDEKIKLHRMFDIPLGKIRVLPIGVDCKKFSGKPPSGLRKRLGLDDNFVILNVSNLNSNILAEKRIEMALKIVSMLPDTTFIHIGEIEPDYKRKLDILVKGLGINKRVIFLGSIHHEKIDDYYRSADVYLQTSRSESFCIPILEAMASGIPVVSTSVGIAKEIIKNGKTGFVIKNEDAARDKIEILKSDSSLRKKIGRYSRNIAEQYDWERVIDKLEKIYKEVVR